MTAAIAAMSIFFIVVVMMFFRRPALPELIGGRSIFAVGFFVGLVRGWRKDTIPYHGVSPLDGGPTPLATEAGDEELAWRRKPRTKSSPPL